MYRGRLIFPMVADIRRLDTLATAADPDAGGPLASGYDADFHEVIQVPNGTQHGVSARKEKASLSLRCQVESDKQGEGNQTPTGNAEGTQITLVFMMADLEAAGLVDGITGAIAMQVGDRLAAIYRTDGTLVQSFADPPGMYATKVMPQAYGMSIRRRNLLLVTFSDRPQGIAGL